MGVTDEHSGDAQHFRHHAVVIGASAGGFHALPTALKDLPADFPAAVVVVQHVPADSDQRFFHDHIRQRIKLPVAEAVEREPVKPGTVYVAPPGYHLLIEKNRTFALSTDRPVNYSRPSIDVLFESAALVYGHRLIGVILTGASADGANGLQCIRASGGMVIVQDPETAESSAMPSAAIAAGPVDHVVPLAHLSMVLVKKVMEGRRSSPHP